MYCWNCFSGGRCGPLPLVLIQVSTCAVFSIVGLPGGPGGPIGPGSPGGIGRPVDRGMIDKALGGACKI